MNTMRIFLLFAITLLFACGQDTNSSNEASIIGEEELPDISEIDASKIGVEDTIKAKATYEITSDPAIDQAKLYDAVMNIHDDVMPKLADINKIKVSLVSRLKNNKNIDSATKKVIDDLITQMNDANKSMFDWMHAFKQKGSDVSHDDYMKYLNEEKVKISEVKTKILNAIAEGKAFTDPVN